jgi:tRNA(fMet)-specific endonuclease VapC
LYILDTNTLIYFFKGVGKVDETLLSKSPNDIYIPSIVLFELQSGIEKSMHPAKRKKQLNLLVSHVNIVDFGTKEAESAAKIRADLEKKGMPIGPYDTLIAGTALAKNAILVTHNIKEFGRITALKIEDWYCA